MTKEEVIQEINQALKDFGEYDYFYNSGAAEVLDISKMVNKIFQKYKTPGKIAIFLEELYNEEAKKIEPFLCEAIYYLVEEKFNEKEGEEFLGIDFVSPFY